MLFTTENTERTEEIFIFPFLIMSALCNGLRHRLEQGIAQQSDPCLPVRPVSSVLSIFLRRSMLKKLRCASASLWLNPTFYLKILLQLSAPVLLYLLIECAGIVVGLVDEDAVLPERVLQGSANGM